jgi:hypothetical protein
MEYQASSNKAKFKCSLTKNLYALEDINKWLSTPEVQNYIRSGHTFKWGSKTKEGQPTQYSNGMQLEVTYYAVKPYNQGYSKPTMQQPNPFQNPQAYQTNDMDDQLPTSPSSENEWLKNDNTEFNPEQYEKELM